MVYSNYTTPTEQTIRLATPEIIIRKMQLQDLNKVWELETRIFRDPWSRNHLYHEILDNSISFSFVVERDREVIGYAIYWFIDNEAHIAKLAIDASFRGKQYGDFLLCRVLEEMKCQKVQVVYLEVRRSNQAAQQLYLKHGFKLIGTRRNYYSNDKEDALLMSLSLKEG
ncbi:MAG: ribosomal protein S18-alanine N-acetyltransferase [bacterium]